MKRRLIKEMPLEDRKTANDRCPNRPSSEEETHYLGYYHNLRQHACRVVILIAFACTGSA